ncbi:unnamed protein product [Paramecium sonneborni]|uniref:Uncharacterized protein n=1 Tax=Paramecium sonneborni TaxID=65129 RepID=A0A8S1NAM2_9CILI|nr:unnamed protein product [Paramecium sonneborni]
MFCVSLALFGTAFLGFLGYLIQIQMPFLKFKMIDRETTQNALYTSSIFINNGNTRYMNDYQKQLFIMSDQQQLKQEVLSNEVYKTCFKILPVNASQEEFKKCMGNYIQSYEIIQQAFEQFFKKPKFPQQQQ